MLIQIPLDRRSSMPLYEQIYRHLRCAIEKGGFVSGEKLPSKRSLAAMCGVGLVTVETAYAQLAAEGFVDAKARSGYFAAEQIESGPALPSLTAEPHLPIPPPGEDILYDCRFGRVDTSQFPVKIWRSLLRDALSDTEVLQTGAAAGEAALRREIASYLERMRGVRCSAEQIVVGAGLEWLLLTLLPLFPKDALYGLEEPGYDVYRHVLERFGRRTVFLPVGRGGLQTDGLRGINPDILYLTPSHQFPSGEILSYGGRRKILAWAKGLAGRYILEDDYDSEFRYRGLPIPSLQSMDQQGRVVYLGSFSKSLAPSLRIGYMALPKPLAERWLREGRFSCAVSRLDQLALAEFMKEGHFERHIARLRTVYRRRRELLFDLLAPYTPQLQGEDDFAGVFVRLRVNCGLDEEALLQRARQAGVRLSGESKFYATQPPAIPTLLWGIGGVNDEDLPDILLRLTKAWGI